MTSTPPQLRPGSAPLPVLPAASGGPSKPDPVPLPDPAQADTGIDTQDQTQGTEKTRSSPMSPNSVNLTPMSKALPAVERWLQQLSGGKYDKLSVEQKKALSAFLQQFDPTELMAASVQGKQGEAARSLLTGSGEAGHYVNSLLNSLAQLIQTDRLSPDLLKAVNDLATAELHPDLHDQRQALLSSSLQNIAFPEKINQHARGTCAAGAVEIMLAVEDPVLYVQIMQGLASPGGEVGSPPLKDGFKMQREPDTLGDDKSGRSLSSRLMQPAFMEYANDQLDYNNAKDQHFDQGKFIHKGLTVAECHHVTEALFGKGKALLITGGPQSDLLAAFEDQLNQGRPVSCSIMLDRGGHQVLLTAIDRQNNQAYFMNPWGELQSMPLDEFQSRAFAGIVNDAAPAGNKPALSGLPGAAADLDNYVPIYSAAFKKNSVAAALETDPASSASRRASSTASCGSCRPVRWIRACSIGWKMLRTRTMRSKPCDSMNTCR